MSGMTGWQIVITDAGFHIRFLAENHEPVVSSEVYTRRAAAVHAVELVAGENEMWSWVDERTATPTDPAQTGPERVREPHETEEEQAHG